MQFSQIDCDLKLVGWPDLRWLSLNGAMGNGALEIRDMVIGDITASHAILSENHGHQIQGVSVEHRISFEYAALSRQTLQISQCTIGADAVFDGFCGTVSVLGCSVVGAFSLEHSDGALLARDFRVGGDMRLGGSKLQSLKIERSEFLTAWSLGAFGSNSVVIRNSHFDATPMLSVSANVLDLSGCIFGRGAQISASYARITLDRVAVVNGRVNIIGLSDDSSTVSIESMNAADAGSFRLSGISLANCLINKADRVDQMRVDRTVQFRRPPRLLSRRKCTYDEVAWRSRNGRMRRFWLPPNSTLRKGTGISERHLHEIPDIGAAAVAGIYGALRSGLEHVGNGGEAGDFYYGEMEMRRLDRGGSWTDRLILTLYWITSGYGLKAWRALFCLAGTISIIGPLISRYGYPTPTTGERPGWVDGMLYALQTSVPSSGVSADLTRVGVLLDVLVSILVPVLFALGVLAVRSRVRR